MKHVRHRNSNVLATHRKLSLNTVVLPPLSPTFAEHGNEILEQFLVGKKPTGVNGEVVTIGRTTEIGRPDSQKSSDSSRTAQLEQNIRYLQEQHQLMLTGLHHEIDNLRHRNRELQFQLVFAKGTNASTPSSPEDDPKHKLYSGPKVNVTPLQVELLEKELGELKLQMAESESRNVYLSAIVDEQKKKLERYERERERERERGLQPDPELLRKLDDAESLIRRLRRENSDLRRENATNSMATPPFQPREYHNRDNGGNTYPQRGGRGNGGRNRSNGSNQFNNRTNNWFPPLHSQSFWQNGRSQERMDSGSQAETPAALPTLQPGAVQQQQQQYQGRRGGNNNHYNNHGDGRKYRGNQNHRGPKAS